MYSVLLAAALTAGTAEVPQWHYGCHGCWGCHGCCGGNAFSCGGCWGCCGGCYGCGGCWGCSGCYGCGGCYGVSCYGCCGGCCGGWSCHGCTGCWGCHGCHGGVIIVHSAHVVPAHVAPAHVVPAHPKKKKEKDDDDDDEVGARVLVKLPADASMYVDGVKADLTSGTRTFTTPALTAGRDYFYTIRVEAVRDGQTVSQSQRVVVRANQTSQVEFGEFTAGTGTVKAPAKVVVKLPADAKLYVDGVLCPQTTATRSFETPQLKDGVKYAYTLKAEVVRDGKVKAETKRVEMTAGKEVSVDFGDMRAVEAVAR